MNVSDPLWKDLFPHVPRNNSSPSSKKVEHILSKLLAPHNTTIAASNTTGASSPPNATSSTSSKNATLTSSGVDAIVSAINNLSSPGSHLWSFNQFIYVSVAITVITIALPLIAGPIFRSALQSFYHYKGYWRISAFVLVLSIAIILDVFTPAYVFVIVFNVPQVLLAVWKLYQAHVRGYQKKRWVGYATILAISMQAEIFAFSLLDYSNGFDLTSSYYGSVSSGLGGQVSNTFGFIPPTYLFVVWIQTDRPLFTTKRILDFKERLPAWITQIPYLPKELTQSKTYTRYKKIITGILFLAVCGCNLALSLFSPAYIYVTAAGVPFCLYGLEKLIHSFKQRQGLRKWIFFFMVLSLSMWLQVSPFWFNPGVLVLLPSITLWTFAHHGRLLTYLRKHSRRLRFGNPPFSATSADPGQVLPMTAVPPSGQTV